MLPKGHRLLAGGCCLAAICWLAGSQRLQSTTSAASAPTKPSVDLEQLAERLVTQTAGIKPGELVFVSGGTQDQELLENIAVHVRRLGAFPLVAINSDRLAKRLFFDVPDTFDAQPDALGMAIAEKFDAGIFVSYNLEEGVFAGADPKRQAARAKTNQAVMELLMKRKVRQVEVGNSMYPTGWRAKRFGMTDAELAKTFWEGVNVDYTALAARAEQVKTAIAAGREIRLTDANGSDLRVGIQARPVFASDGIITADEAKQGGAAVNVYLPAGEVYVTPVAGTAEGKIVRPKDYYEGKEIENLTLTFAGGKLTEMTGSGPGFAPLKAFYDAAAAGKEMFALVDFGINEHVKLPANAVVGTWIPAGTVTVGIGNNLWAGGSNDVPYAYYVSMPGTTVMLDDKVIVEKGVLKL